MDLMKLRRKRVMVNDSLAPSDDDDCDVVNEKDSTNDNCELFPNTIMTTILRLINRSTKISL